MISKKIIPFILLCLTSVNVLTQDDSLKYLGSFGSFRSAVSISSAREKFIYISDLESNKIYKFSLEGKELASFGGAGLGANELNQPYSVDATNGLDVLIADYQNNRIKRLDINLNFILSFDFNSYNLTSESSKKIFNPKSVMTMSTGEVFVICDATNFKAAKLNDYSEVSLLFGSNSVGIGRLDSPVKIVKGNQLDVWILDTAANEIANYSNFGTYSKNLNPGDGGKIISIAYFNDNLLILRSLDLMVYDLKKGQYSNYYRYPSIKNLRDISIFDKNTILLLGKEKVYKFSFQ